MLKAKLLQLIIKLNISDAALDEHQAMFDDLAVDIFAQEMKAKISSQRLKGKKGWYSKDKSVDEEISKVFNQRLAGVDNEIDLAILLMLAWHRETPIQASQKD